MHVPERSDTSLSIDPSAVAMLKEWLRQYTPQGRTVFMTSHVLETVERHSLVIRSLWGTSNLDNSPAALCGAFRGMGFQPMRGGEAQPPPCGCPSSSGYCPQDLLIFEGLTVAENLRYFAAAYGLSQTNDGWYRAAQGLAERFRCNSFLDTPVSRLSGGSKQKVNLRWPPSRYR